MFFGAEDLSLDLQKTILKECPIRSKSHAEWLAYLDKLEAKVRTVHMQESINQVMFKLYEGACSGLPELWTEEAYLVLLVRKAVLALYEDKDTGLTQLSICAMNARRNPQLVIAVAFYYTQVGRKLRAQSLINSCKKYSTPSGLRLLHEAEELIVADGDLKPLLGPFHYEPPYQIEPEINVSSSSNYELFFNSGSPSDRFRATKCTIRDSVGENIYANKRSLSNWIVPKNLEAICISSTSTLQPDVVSSSLTSSGSLPCATPETKDSENPSGPFSPILPTAVTSPEQRLSFETTESLTTSTCFSVNGKKYRVLDVIGRGGSSVVYSVLDSDRRMWALKDVQLIGACKELVNSYANEVAMLLTLRDTGRVIRLHDYEQDPSSLRLVLELASVDLKDVLEELMEPPVDGVPNDGLLGRIPPLAVVFYWDQMLRCVKVLHDQRIVHLDLKPQNFVLVRGRLKLIDLGISQRLPDDMTRVNPALQLGTLTYMSPEQLEGPTPITTSGGLSEEQLKPIMAAAKELRCQLSAT
ncbi:hypothetical protein EG68_10446 [Paragonimus skrjabini miyazakii]|uniref:Protein kinase domain-containing protein n=1 Tax=Paragonimus skrjabini miyazakii TaxID=59628 RepID=A0A8S9YS91_9TREM|nr:hypothetical protein EG68_10446 [Paragonimus skrjabini miyazakii]